MDNGREVCNFTVAVNRPKNKNGQQEADFFRVAVFDEMGKNCQKYLAKGKKVAVVGPVNATLYTAKDGNTRVSLNVVAKEVEFLTPKAADGGTQTAPTATAAPAPAEVSTDDLPF